MTILPTVAFLYEEKSDNIFYNRIINFQRNLKPMLCCTHYMHFLMLCHLAQFSIEIDRYATNKSHTTEIYKY